VAISRTLLCWEKGGTAGGWDGWRMGRLEDGSIPRNHVTLGLNHKIDDTGIPNFLKPARVTRFLPGMRWDR
jgi:hypothetical protein